MNYAVKRKGWKWIQLKILKPGEARAYFVQSRGMVIFAFRTVSMVYNKIMRVHSNKCIVNKVFILDQGTLLLSLSRFSLRLFLHSHEPAVKFLITLIILELNSDDNNDR